MSLTPRLEAVKNAVEHCDVILDVGTDHAYVPIALVQEGVCGRAIAADINRGPLLRAKKHIRQNKLERQIETRLGSGLSVVRPNEVQTAVLAGMGGVLISQLLAADSAVANSIGQLVLQPMNAPEYLRHHLHENGYRITQEYLAAEGAKTYVILQVCRGEESYDSEVYYHIGKKLFERYGGTPLFTAYCEHKKKEFQKMLAGQKRATQPDQGKIAFLRQLIKDLEGMETKWSETI